jgi:addiction module RelE/StbE family toxin
MSSNASKPWSISYVKSAVDDISELDGSAKRIIKNAIEDKLMVDPLKFGKPLRRNLSGLFKLRVGDYRIIYQVKENEVIVVIVKVGHRREVYED